MKNKNLNILIILLIFFVGLHIIRVLKLIGICCMIISILSPLFFGYVLSWIIKPIIDKVRFNRVVMTSIIYLLFIGSLVFILFNFVPLILEESKKIVLVLKYYVFHNEILYKIYNSFNIKEIIVTNFNNMNECLNNIFSIFINIIYSFIFGFYFLIRKNGSSYFNFIPKKLKRNISKELRLYIKSIMLDTLFMLLILSVLFFIIKLPSPIVFALFCAITNIIPYLGPYIGGIPAVLIGLSTSIELGIIVLIIIVLVQIIESNIIQPLIVSKNVHLNPIYILVGVIIFGHFFGIIGMIISTPVVIVLRNIIKYYKKNKPKWFNLILDRL